MSESKRKRGGTNRLQKHHEKTKSQTKRGRIETVGSKLKGRYLEEKRTSIEAFLVNARENGKTNSNSFVQILRDFAVSKGGLVSEELRREIWPILLGVDPDSVKKADVDLSKVPEKDMKVIRNDVNRSLLTYSICKTFTNLEREIMREKLSSIQTRVLARNHLDMHYYQGYHDVASVHLLVLGVALAEHTLEAHSKLLLSKYLEKTIDSTSKTVALIPVILKNADEKVSQILIKNHVQAFFSMSWIITAFAHDIDDLELVCRIFDVFISSHELFPVYFSAALILHPTVKKELLRLNKSKKSAGSEMHTYLKGIPKLLYLTKKKTKGPGIDVESIVRSALELVNTISPSTFSV